MTLHWRESILDRFADMWTFCQCTGKYFRVIMSRADARAIRWVSQLFGEMQMKTLLIMAFVLFAADVFAADCVTNELGKLVCSDGQSAVGVNPKTGKVTTAQKPQSGVKTAQTSTGAKAAYNPKTGNAAISQTNPNGVKTTQTSRGGEAKTKNGKGAVEGPNGAKCAKGVNNQGCKK
jgi:hypothetical protein